jgi:hypothetical protein
MLYWSLLLFFASLISGVFAFFGSEIAKVLLVMFALLCAWTLWQARRGSAPNNRGPDS